MPKHKASQLAILLLLSLLTYTFNIKLVIAAGTIYIRNDGSVDPPTAPIQRNGDTYTFTNNIMDSIVVEKDNILIDGVGYILQGTGSEIGIYVSHRTNVTIQNIKIKNFDCTIYLSSSNNITIIKNTIAESNDGIWLSYSSGNNIIENNITANAFDGIYMYYSSLNIISGNNIEETLFDAIYLFSSSNNIIFMNNIVNNGYGISPYYSSNNKVFHNNFINNTNQVNPNTPTDMWDDGYPSGGNYWSDYTGIDQYSGPNQNQPGSDGIGDTPYIIDENNQDHYPLMTTHDIGIQNLTTSKTVVCQGYTVGITKKITNYGANSETFNVAIYANTTSIATQAVTLRSIKSITLTFTWNTTGYAKGNYTIWAYAWPVPGETHTEDNTFTDGWIFVAMVGDIDGDNKVSGMDLTTVAWCFGSYPGHPRWNPNADIDGDNKVSGLDLTITARNFGKADP